MDNKPSALLKETLRLPLLVAPMFLVSSPAMVVASCKAGVLGSFPTPNARPLAQLASWIRTIEDELAAVKIAHPDKRIAPWAINLVRHRSYGRRDAELALVAQRYS